ncbi:MAG: hypothetical protein V3T84_09870 [Phycisphaerales bacterium]
MTRDELKAMLADYLGDELGGDRKVEFEAALARDPKFGAEVRGLQETLERLRTLDAPTPMPTATSKSARSSAVPKLLRYAAVLALAFVGGYLARGPAAELPRPPLTGTSQETVGASSSESADAWRLRLAKAYAEHPSDSSLARSLVALVHSSE